MLIQMNMMKHSGLATIFTKKFTKSFRSGFMKSLQYSTTGNYSIHHKTLDYSRPENLNEILEKDRNISSANTKQLLNDQSYEYKREKLIDRRTKYMIYKILHYFFNSLLLALYGTLFYVLLISATTENKDKRLHYK